MADLSNAYRDQVRQLLRRRIQEARTRLLNAGNGKVADAEKQAEARPAVAELRQWKQKYDDLQKQISSLEKERDEAAEQFRKATKEAAVKDGYYYHRSPEDDTIETIKSKIVSEILSSDPELGPKLKELDALNAQIGDLLVLALTTTKLRAVVKMFNDRLGASITDVEKEILGIEDD
jgi:hypothetical protein